MAILRVKHVAVDLGVAESTVWRWVAEGRLPRPVRIGPNAVGWHSDVLDAWTKALPPA